MYCIYVFLCFHKGRVRECGKYQCNPVLLWLVHVPIIHLSCRLLCDEFVSVYIFWLICCTVKISAFAHITFLDFYPLTENRGTSKLVSWQQNKIKEMIPNLGAAKQIRGAPMMKKRKHLIWDTDLSYFIITCWVTCWQFIDIVTCDGCGSKIPLTLHVHCAYCILLPPGFACVQCKHQTV